MGKRITHNSRSDSGFTLIDILVVTIVVGILAAIALPMYQGAMTRAHLSEADATLGSIRSRLRETLLFQAPATDWAVLSARYEAGLSVKITDIPELQIAADDLKGRYFDHNAYRLKDFEADSFTVYCMGDSSTAIQKNSVSGLIRSIDHKGSLNTVENRPPRGRSEERRQDNS